MVNRTDSKIRAIKPGGEPLSDGMITGFRLHPHARNWAAEPKPAAWPKTVLGLS